MLHLHMNTIATQAWMVDETGEERAGEAFLRGSQAGQALRWLNIGRQGIPTISANLIERTQYIAASPEVKNESTP